ncbi:hypothetical protein FGB62_1g260 [Gracilaria domingensis]|nr:hypothetical protein FGB62_1g260 [Gracilaria domingensis]
MAYLYETATWRAIVRATRDPKILLAFSAVTVAGGYLFAKGSQIATDVASEQTKEEMEQHLKKNWEAERYAKHSKNALAVMFDNVRKEDEPDVNEKHKRYPVKLPGVMWHPKVAERERQKAKLQRQEAEVRD